MDHDLTCRITASTESCHLLHARFYTALTGEGESLRIPARKWLSASVHSSIFSFISPEAWLHSAGLPNAPIGFKRRSKTLLFPFAAQSIMEAAAVSCQLDFIQLCSFSIYPQLRGIEPFVFLLFPFRQKLYSAECNCSAPSCLGNLLFSSIQQKEIQTITHYCTCGQITFHSLISFLLCCACLTCDISLSFLPSQLHTALDNPILPALWS